MRADYQVGRLIENGVAAIGGQAVEFDGFFPFALEVSHAEPTDILSRYFSIADSRMIHLRATKDASSWPDRIRSYNLGRETRRIAQASRIVKVDRFPAMFCSNFESWQFACSLSGDFPLTSLTLT